MGSTRLMLLLAALCGCGSKDGGGSTSSSAPPTAPSESVALPPSASAVLSARRPAPSASTAQASEPAKLSSPVRDNSAVSAYSMGARFEARVFVSRITTADPIHVGFALTPEVPIGKDHPWVKETVELAKVVGNLRFEIKTPAGTRVLEADSKPSRDSHSNLAGVMQEVSIDEKGVTQYNVLTPWKAKAPDLLKKPGKYTLTISGNIKTVSRTIPVAAPPLELEVVEATATFKTLAELETIASNLVREKRGLAAAPRATAAVVDDVDGGRWFRFQLANDGHARYDVEVVEVLLDASGRELNVDSFLHFTCLAEGTRVATPNGPIAVERLVVGDRVTAFDVESRTKTSAVVEQIQRAHSERLVAFGELRVTPAHPLFADGRWRAAGDVAPSEKLLFEDLTTRVVEPLSIDTPATVYELSVSPPHTYFAGGVLLHNKAVYEPIGGRNVPWQGWFFRRAAKRS